MAIRAVTARSILDSRGIPTIETTVTTDKVAATASVPSGTSTGSHEAKELRDEDRRWQGKGVAKAVSHVNAELSHTLRGKDVFDYEALDTAMSALDGTPDKSRLGANAILSVSLACVRAAALSKGKELWKFVGTHAGNKSPVRTPLPLCNVINGGAHADNPLAIQEFMLVPHGFNKFSEAVRAATETFHSLGKLLKGRGAGTGVGAEGGYAPNLDNHRIALDMMMEAIREAGYEPGKQISLALDVAASEFYRDGSYVFEGQPLTAEQMTAFYGELLDSYPLFSIEDPLAEDDWEGWEHLASRLRDRVQLVGDDLTVTNTERVEEATRRDVLTAAILKPNQVGTYTETLAAFRKLTEAGNHAIISHRSGETNDDFIADLAVGWGASQIKAGSVSRGERVAKYNRLLEIDQQLGGNAVFAGPELAKGKRG